MKEPSLFRMKYRGLQVLIYSPADRRRKRYKEVDGKRMKASPRENKEKDRQQISVYNANL